MKKNEENLSNGMPKEGHAMEWLLIILVIALFVAFFLMIVAF